MLKAKDIMTVDVITVKPETTVEELARLLIEHKISGVPVVDDNDQMIGVVTENDLIKKNARLHIPTIIRLFDAYILLNSDKVEDDIKKMVAGTVDEICNKDIVSLTEETKIALKKTRQERTLAARTSQNEQPTVTGMEVGLLREKFAFY